MIFEQHVKRICCGKYADTYSRYLSILGYTPFELQVRIRG